MNYLDEKINFNIKTAIILAAAVVFVFNFIPINDAQALTCSLTPQSGRTIIYFNDAWLVANGAQDQATGGPISTWLPQGSYDITLASYDCHSCHSGQDQPSESWYMILKNSQGNTVANTPAISDLPDNLNYLTEKVATNFSISQDISSATVFHAAYPLNWNESANSITAICAAFDRINVNPPDLIINKAVDKSQASPGEEIVYTLNYENIGDTQATGVVIKDVFNYTNQQYLTFISATPSPSSGNDTWTLGTLNPGQSGQIFITAKVKDTVPLGTTEIKNRFSIDSNETSFMYSNCVNFTVTVIGNPELTISKLGRNITENTSWAETTDSRPSQKVGFSIQVSNTGDAVANNVYVQDSLPYKLVYVYGSTKIDSVSAPDSIIYGGINIGNISVGQSKTITFEADVANEVYFSVGQTTLINTGKTWATGVATITDTAQIIIEKTGQPSLSIDKLVRNITKSSAFSQSIAVNPKDEVEFSLEIHSTGTNTANNVKVWDNLPNRLKYISGSTTIDGFYKNDGIISGGIYIGNINSGQSKTVKFKAKVDSENMFNVGITNLTNYGYTNADNFASIYDTAAVNVDKSSGCSPSLHVDKLGRNITQGHNDWTNTVVANSGDEIEFLIKINSIGTETAQNTKIRDELPSRLEYISGSTKVDDSYKTDGIISSSGISIGDLGVGSYKEIKFKAQITSADNFSSSSTTLTNYAYAWAGEKCKINDYAQVEVRKQTILADISGEVKGVATIKTGANSISLIFLAVISALIAFILYCRTREEKLLEVLNSDKTKKLFRAFIKLYFRLKFFITVAKLRFKRFYW